MKVALVENSGADFVGSRIRYALFLKRNGFEVVAIVPNDGHKHFIEEAGIRTIEVGKNIRAKGVSTKILYAKKLRKEFIKGDFDIIHFYRFQPNVIGTIVAGLYCKSKIVNHITGLGISFSNNNIKSKLHRIIIKFIYKFNHIIFKPYYIFQNEQDAQDLKIFKRKVCIKGSAVDEERFNLDSIRINSNDKILKLKNEFSNIEHKSKIFLFVSRIIKEKGVMELIDGFRNANMELDNIHKLLIVGWSDLENPSAISKDELENYIQNDENIVYLGKRSDIELLIALSDVSILPTYYREGTPRFLLESMVMKKAIITTCMPGCDQLVKCERNGQLIQPKSTLEVKKAILSILNRNIDELGKESHKLYFEEYSEEIVYSNILKLYSKV